MKDFQPVFIFLTRPVPGLPSAPPEEPAQAELFGDDYSQPDACGGEPVFWDASAGSDQPDDDLQPDAPE